MKPGRLFVFEGLDGAGKTTLAKHFSERLRAAGRSCEEYSFPGSEEGSLGNLVYRLHHEKGKLGVATIDPTALQILHIAAHIDGIERIIRPALITGKDVVLDRYWWSTSVYGRLTRANPDSLTRMVNLEKAHWGSILPATVFLVERGNATADYTKSKRSEASLEYERLAQAEANAYPVKVIKNKGAIEDALEEAMTFIEKTSNNTRVKGHPKTTGLTGNSVSIFVPLSPAKPTVVYETYWKFAAERQAVFFRRIAGKSSPWTDDPIIQEYRFTNAYRASDRVSQYLINEVIGAETWGVRDLFFRIILFKMFNRIGTWELIKAETGEVTWSSYKFRKYDQVLSEAMACGERIYSAAYIMPAAGTDPKYSRKHQTHLALIEEMMKSDLPERIQASKRMRDVFELLRSFRSIGDFLAFQYTIDINYSSLTNFSEMDFVVPGPGALRGISKCFTDLGGLNETELIKMVADKQEEEIARYEVSFRDLWGRPLQLIDCQNLFCEVDKYSRIAHPELSSASGRMRIKQKFRENLAPVVVRYPKKWGLDDNISVR